MKSVRKSIPSMWPLIAGSLVLLTLAGCGSLIDLKVRNTGKKAQSFADSAQKAHDAKKVEYSADSTAGLYANGDQQFLYQEINPGNSAHGQLVFDVPVGTELTSLELHDSLFSGGVTVALK